MQDLKGKSSEWMCWFSGLFCSSALQEAFAEREEKGDGFQMLKLGGVEKEEGGRERRGEFEGRSERCEEEEQLDRSCIN